MRSLGAGKFLMLNNPGFYAAYNMAAKTTSYDSGKQETQRYVSLNGYYIKQVNKSDAKNPITYPNDQP